MATDRAHPGPRTAEGAISVQSIWKAWSGAIDDAEALTTQIAGIPVRSLADLSLKFDALLWEISLDGLDDNSVEKLQVWGDKLRLLAASELDSVQSTAATPLLDTHSEQSGQRVTR